MKCLKIFFAVSLFALPPALVAEEATAPDETAAKSAPVEPDKNPPTQAVDEVKAETEAQVKIERDREETAADKPVVPGEAGEQGGVEEEPAAEKPQAEAKTTETPAPKEAESGKKTEPPPPAEPVKPVRFGFESIGGWKAAAWADGVELSEVNAPRQEGEKALRLRVNKPKQGKVAISLEMPIRLADYNIITVDVCLESDKNYPALLTVGLVTGDRNIWVESVPRLLQKGWNTGLRFDLCQNEWKSEATKWRYCTSALGKGEARSIHLLFHGLDYDESVVIDNLVFLPAETRTEIRAEAKLADVERIIAAAAGKRESVDLTRADAIRAYALSAIADYATDLAAAGQTAEAKRLAEIVRTANAAPLVARTMPAPAAQEPSEAAKSTETKAGAEKSASPTPAAEQPKEVLLITIPRRGAIMVAGEEARRGTVGRRLKELFREKGDQPLTIRVEADVPLAKISEVEEACKEAGFSVVNIERQ